MARLLYRLLLLLLVPALIVRLLWRARKQPEYLQHLGERFGRYRGSATARAGADSPQLAAVAKAADGAARPAAGHPARGRPPLLWLHAVSVGETRAAEPLIKSLAARYPTHQLLITCMTPTGRAAAESLYGSLATIVYLPYDFAFAQRRFLRHWRPALGVLMETELWPNLLFEARAAGLPLALINARLSERSAAGYRRFAALSRPALGALSAVAAQSTADAERLAALGAPPPVVCGNLKFEVRPDPAVLALGTSWKATLPGQRFVWLAASTREGEEALLLDALALLAGRGIAPLLVLVPRHPQRFNEVATLVAARRLKLQRRSLGLPGADDQVWLGDSMGEMAAYYAMAELCVIGGSLLPFGSQNLIEACACACPVLIGPSDFNFRQAASDAIAHGAARRVAADPAGLAAAIAHAMAAPEELAAQRDAALAFAGAHRGATEKTQSVLDGLLAH
jgi:3-deoxy-D-manno-octulosonic-acid transferase